MPYLHRESTDSPIIFYRNILRFLHMCAAHLVLPCLMATNTIGTYSSAAIPGKVMYTSCVPRLVRYLPYDRKCQAYRIVGVGVFYQHEIPHTNSNTAQQNLPYIYKAGRVVYMYSKMILSSSLHNCSNLLWELANCSPRISSMKCASNLILLLEMCIN